MYYNYNILFTTYSSICLSNILEIKIDTVALMLTHRIGLYFVANVLTNL